LIALMFASEKPSKEPLLIYSITLYIAAS
jgi:hypothetical protein